MGMCFKQDLKNNPCIRKEGVWLWGENFPILK